MKNLIMFTTILLLMVMGFARKSEAGAHTAMVVDGCADASPDSVDINTLAATATGGATDNVVVVMVLCANPSSRAHYRVHFDQFDPFASDGNAGCITTSDDTMKRTISPKGTKDTGPGLIGLAANVLTYTVTYAELGLVGGETIDIWADVHRKGIADRAPNTDGTDSCSKPQGGAEVLTITLP